MKNLIYIYKNIFLSIQENELFNLNYYYYNLRNIFIIIKIIFFLYLLYFKNVNSFSKNHIIEIDNNINEILYENDIDFSNYSTNIKIIAIYYPQYIKKDIIYLNNQSQNEHEIIHNTNFLSNNYKKQKKGDENEYYLIKKKQLSKLIKEQIKLAQNHGIYGFGINYYWFSGKIYYDEPINLFLNNKEVNFPYFLIWKNDKLLFYNNEQEKNVIITQNFEKDKLFKFIQDIEKYLISENYIKINEKPILAIYDPLIIPNLKDFLFSLRDIANYNGIGKLYIISTLNNYHKETYKELFDSLYEFPPKNLDLNEYHKNNNFYYYTGLIYRINSQYLNNETNCNIYRGIMLSYNSTKTEKNSIIFNGYSPEKFYIIIKIIIKWTIIHHNENNNFIFINSWNNWEENSYLAPDEYFGYASLNALSKAIFNISLHNTNYNLTYLNNISKVAVQAHIFYEDLIKDIINKINNIPIKYDLFITTTSIKIKNQIKKYISKYSNSNKYEIVIIENKGRDVLPLLTQLKNKIKYYKYLCHIHSKKSKTSPIIGIQWRNYLYNNLLGNSEIVSEIISDFENIYKLGFIYPETFYEIIRLSFILTKKTKYYMKYIIKRLFSYTNIGNIIEFPAGNMFWAKVTAIYQIFELNFNNKFDNERDQTNDTIMHGIERIWLYLVKINGFFYKKIFKNYL